MDYNTLLDIVADLGYRLAVSGAETFRVEECANRILASYGIASEAYAIPNCLIVSIETAEGKPMTRMRRIGMHGNNLNAVERYSNLSRRICAEKPEPKIAVEWMHEIDRTHIDYSFSIQLLGNFLCGFGFCIFFGGNFVESICSGICGTVIGLVNKLLANRVNLFFQTICSSFIMTLIAYAMGASGIAHNTDAVVIGALMLLVPGLLFTNAMRDIIFGDTNSGTNRIVQVLLIAAALALGTGAAWNLADTLWGLTDVQIQVSISPWVQILSSIIGCLGFAIVFNVHGRGTFLCILGGGICWAAYCVVMHFGGSEIVAYFIAGIVSATYSEAMARIRKYPAISYLVISIFPMIPGAGIYYTTAHRVQGDMGLFASQGAHTIAIAGAIAVGILMVSTLFRLWGVWKNTITSTNHTISKGEKK